MKKFTAVLVVVVMIFVSTSAMAQGHRGYGGGHHGGGGDAGWWIAAIAAIFVGTALVRAVDQRQVVVIDQQDQQPVYQNQRIKETSAALTVDTWVGPPNRQGPAQFRGQKCFNNEAYFPNGALFFDSYGQQIDHINPGSRYPAGTCF